MAGKVVTLYIDDTRLRLMETRGKRIKKWVELPLDLGSAKAEDNVKEAEIAAKVKQLFKARKIKAKDVIVGLSGLHCLTRPIILPELPRAMLAEAVIREAKRVLPVPVEQLYISWQPIPAPAGNIQVFLIAIPRKTADTLLKILHQVGLKAYLMDLKPLALTRLLKEKTAVIVDVQLSEFDIVIVADGVPQPVRTLSFPDEVLPKPEKLLTVKEELDRTIEFYNSNHPEKPLNSEVPVFVSGDLVEDPELFNSLPDGLGYPVLPLTSPLKCPKELDPTRYMVNIGLALKELPMGKGAGSSLVNLNALPEPYLPKHISLAKVVALPSAAIIVGLLVLLVMNVQSASAYINSVRGQLDTNNHIIEYKQSQKDDLAKSIADLEKKIAKTDASRDTFTAALNLLYEQGEVINGNLAVTTSCLPGGVNLSKISHAGGKLIIAGRASSEVEILSYARNLDNTARFLEVIVANISRVEGEEGESDEMDFSLVLKIGEQS